MAIDGFTTWTFDVPMNVDETETLIWLLIFGELEIEVDEASSFRVEVNLDDRTTTANIHHRDAETLVRLTEAFYDRRWQIWSFDKLARASYKCLSRLMPTPND